MIKKFPKIKYGLPHNLHVLGLVKIVAIIILISLVITGVYLLDKYYRLVKYQTETSAALQDTRTALTKLQADESYLKNKDLNGEMEALQKTYNLASKSYEELLKLNGDKTNDLEKEYAEIIFMLSEKNYASATAKLTTLNENIKKEQTKQAQAAAAGIPANVATNNTPPGSGYKRQYVKNDYGTYLVDIIAADLNSARVIVDTASDGTCTNDCPVISLGDYASRSGGFAAINGPYFCPESYPSCQDKKNSFDTLIMNKSKVYFNSDNNVYSTVPAVIFSGNSARFVTQSL